MIVDTMSTGRPPRVKGLSRRRLGVLFVTPSVVMMAAVGLFPILYAIVLSFTKYDGRNAQHFGTFENYIRAFFDERLWGSIVATATFTVVSVSLELVIGMAFAVIMNQAFRGRGITRAIILIPWVIPTVVAAQMWSILFNVNPGFINGWLGLGDFNWLGQTGWALFTVILVDVWKTAPFVALLLLAGLQTVPAELGESARMDGANAWQSFWHVTLPLIRPAILVAMLFRTVDALRVYDQPAVMTFGQFGTETLSILVRRYVVETVDLGYGSALSTITFALVLGVGVIFIRLLGRNVMGAAR